MTHDLSDIVDITVEISPLAAARATFNQLLIVGPATYISALARVAEYSSLTEMANAGFTIANGEYLAAELYFSQSPAPDTVWIGRHDATGTHGAVATGDVTEAAEGYGYTVGDVLTVVQAGAIGATFVVATISPQGGILTGDVTEAAEGTGYAVDDIVTVVQAGASGGTFKVATISGGQPTGPIESLTLVTPGIGYRVESGLTTTSANGVNATVDIATITAGTTGPIETLTLVTGGSGYAVASALPTTVHPSGGIGATIDIATITAETCLQAITLCRAANPDWYVGMVTDAVKADHKLIAAWAETATPSTIYAFTTEDNDVLTGAAGNIFEYLKGLLHKRTIGQYSTTPHAIAAIMGYAMGQNSGLANSAYTLKFKNEVGVTAEVLSTTQVGIIEGNNGNVYLNYANYYNIFEQGVMSNGYFFDEILNIDMLVNNMQLTVMDLLYGNPKIPQTEAGVTQLIHAVNQACEQAVTIGFLGPGIWTGMNVLNLSTGDALPRGYLTQASPLSEQSQADREARKAPPIYCCIKEAGAIHQVVIGIYVNR